MKSATRVFLFALISLMFVANISIAQTLTPDIAINFLAGNEDEIHTSAIDADGNLYVAGTFKSPQLVLGANTLARKGWNDIFVLKLNAIGEVAFCKSFYNEGSVVKIKGMQLDTDGNIYLAGNFNGNIRMEPINLYPANMGTEATSSFMLKINNLGEPVWARSFGRNSSLGSMVIDKQKNIYVSGRFGGDILISETGDDGVVSFALTARPRNLNFMLKTNSDGRTQWLKNYGGHLVIDKEQNLYMAGNYSDSIYIGDHVLRTISDIENHNVYLAKADTNGHVLWAKKYCEKQHAFIEGAVLDTVSNSIFLSGTFKSKKLTFENVNIINNGYADIYIAKLDTAGNAIRGKSLGGASSEYAWGLTQMSNEYMVVLGSSFSDSIVWGRNIIRNGPEPSGVGDMFLAVFDRDLNPVWGKGFPKSAGQQLKGIVADAGRNAYVVGDFCSSSAGSQKLKGVSRVAAGQEPTYISQTSLFFLKFNIANVPNALPYQGSDVISLYPNPADTQITIHTGDNAGKGSVWITSPEGRQVYAGTLHNGTSTIPIGHLPQGIYFVRVQAGDMHITQKLIRK